MMWVATAVAAMVVISLAHHMGLVEKVAEVCHKIAKCSICSTFWGTLALLVMEGCPVLLAVAVALFAAYISIWLSLMYDYFHRLYDRLWNRRRK